MTRLSDILMRDTRANQPAAGVAGRIYYVTDENVTERDSGSAWEDISDAGGGGGGGGAEDYILIEDQKSAGTEGGTFTSGAWRQRDVNTEVVDTGNHASVGSNQITLAAGTYRYHIACPNFLVNYNQARLYDVTNSAVIRSSQNGYSETGQQITTITGRMVVSGTTVFQVEHRCNNTRSTNGFGVAINSQFTVDVERYTVCEFWREA